jgi:hypothetical protein
MVRSGLLESHKGFKKVLLGKTYYGIINLKNCSNIELKYMGERNSLNEGKVKGDNNG